MTAGQPAYFELPSYPSRAIFTQVEIRDNKTIVLAPKAITIDSEKYWAYIDSQRKEDSIFNTIPTVKVDDGEHVAQASNATSSESQAPREDLGDTLEDLFGG